MAIIMGPVLKLLRHDQQNKDWRVSVLLVVEQQADTIPTIRYEADGATENIKAQPYGHFSRAADPAGDPDALPKRFRGMAVNWQVYGAEISVPRGDKQKTVHYWITTGGQPYPFAVFTDNKRQPDHPLPEGFEFIVPGRSGQLSFAYASCNGFSSEKVMTSVDDPNALWRWMLDRHQGKISDTAPPYAVKNELSPQRCRAYHLLLLGGDQVYADNIYAELDWLQALNAKRKTDFCNYLPSKADFEDLEAFYFSLYVQRWATPTEPRGHCAHLFARIPSLCMWDDHDIIDGWGSFEDRENMAPTSLAMFNAAHKAFLLFQQHIPVMASSTALQHGGFLDETVDAIGQPTGALSFGHCIDGIAILALDARSKRTRRRILEESDWHHLEQWFAQIGAPKHLFVMLGIPAMHADYSAIADAAGKVPNDMVNELQDDMFDHWATREQKGDRSRLIKKLFAFAQATNCRISLLSGDVHVAVAAVIRDQRHNERYNGDEIYQLTSSGIVHPPPSWLQLLALETLFMPNTEIISEGIEGRRISLGDGGPKSLRRRNWMSLEFEAARSHPAGHDDTLWVNWFAENETDAPYKLPVEYPRLR